eukprot:CAMPEP_0117576350 /NCGR_PEP_ID=MMETSP0784-20121206/62747_1 /TAXON_ID=39447 /ORGANISM="" /LENGTH=48 /DNA_ID= /DNA_START= /DNA_END= /DNA_ORIENTATION=
MGAIWRTQSSAPAKRPCTEWASKAQDGNRKAPHTHPPFTLPQNQPLLQ